MICECRCANLRGIRSCSPSSRSTQFIQKQFVLPWRVHGPVVREIYNCEISILLLFLQLLREETIARTLLLSRVHHEVFNYNSAACFGFSYPNGFSCSGIKCGVCSHKASTAHMHARKVRKIPKVPNVDDRSNSNKGRTVQFVNAIIKE